MYVTKPPKCNPFAKGFRYLCGMKNAIRTFRVAFAVVMVLLLTLVPHHHHKGGAACWVVEVCHEDGRHNDEHTAHGEKDHSAAHYSFWKAPSADGASWRHHDAGGSQPSLILLPHLVAANLLPECPSREIRSSYYNVSYSLRHQPANHVFRRGPPEQIS